MIQIMNLITHYAELTEKFNDLITDLRWSENDISYIRDIIEYNEFEDALSVLLAIASQNRYTFSSDEIEKIEELEEIMS